MPLKEVVDVVRKTGYETHAYFKNDYLEKGCVNAVAPIKAPLYCLIGERSCR